MGPGVFFPANPDLADILGDADVDFENFNFPLTCFSTRSSDLSMVENRVFDANLVARLRAQFFSYFLTH